MFSAAIILRYKMKNAERPFRIGKNSNVLIWIVGGVGFLSSLTAFVLSFIKPSQLTNIDLSTWLVVLIIGAVVVVVTPFIIFKLRKDSWKDPNSDIEPFHWEESATVSNQAK